MEKFMLKRLSVKAVLIVAQGSWIVTLIGYLIFRSGWVVAPAMLSIAILIFVRCSRCGTSFQDDRINQKARLIKFYDTSIIDECPVCRKPMFPR
jgi:hypothetical protein